MENKSEVESRYAALMEKVRAMPRGENLEALFEREFTEIKNLAYGQAVQERVESVDLADFPPSTMRKL